MLTVSGIRAGYGATVILEDVDLALVAGEALAILGRNGVGKTTLLSTVMGRTTLHGGSIALGGRRIDSLPTFQRVRLGLGYVPQTGEVFPSLTVEENLMVAVRQGHARTPGRIYEMFPRLAERRRHNGNQLSGGEQRMLAIGRALMGAPDVLLLDEPFEGLAPRIVDGLMTVVRDLITGGLTIMLVEQSVRRALEMTHTAVVLSRGRIVWRGGRADMPADPRHLSQVMLEG